jgi:arylsulfatase A-like enzyme
LSQNAVTIAEALKPAGYASYLCGKWHVTSATKPKTEAEKHNWPLQRGFDRFYGTIHGAGSFFDPNTLTRDNRYISPYADPEYPVPEYYYTDAINDHAVRFVDEHARNAPEKPFFLYMAHTAAHWPMHAREKDVAKYRGRYDAGYDPIRTARLAKMKRLQLLDPRWQATPQAGEWSKVEDKEWEARCMEVYAAMVDCMDQGIGRLLERLKKNGQYENTLILFLQDNGGCAEPMGRNTANQPRAEAPSLPPLPKEFLQPDMVPKQTRDGYPVRQGTGVLPGGADTYIGYGKGWANVSNTPFREYKHWEHEGGISTPLIAHWPKGIAAKGGGELQTKRFRNSEEGLLCDVPGHLIDILSTCVKLAGAAYPTEYGGKSIQPMEGVSLDPLFTGGPIVRAQPLFWEHEGNRAVRSGQWKLVSKHPGGWELYDLSTDRTETTDLAREMPERVQEMAAVWEAWAKRAGVSSWPPPGGEPPRPKPRERKG